MKTLKKDLILDYNHADYRIKAQHVIDFQEKGHSGAAT
jgi:hypothetical protein